MIAQTSLPSRHCLGQQVLSPTIQVHIEQSKVDPFCQMVKGKTDQDVCPVRAIVAYLAKRSSKPGPLFILSDGKWLTCTIFSSVIDNILSEMQIDKESYNTHGFQIVLGNLSINLDICH